METANESAPAVDTTFVMKETEVPPVVNQQQKQEEDHPSKQLSRIVTSSSLGNGEVEEEEEKKNDEDISSNNEQQQEQMLKKRKFEEMRSVTPSSTPSAGAITDPATGTTTTTATSTVETVKETENEIEEKTKEKKKHEETFLKEDEATNNNVTEQQEEPHQPPQEEVQQPGQQDITDEVKPEKEKGTKKKEGTPKEANVQQQPQEHEQEPQVQEQQQLQQTPEEVQQPEKQDITDEVKKTEEVGAEKNEGTPKEADADVQQQPQVQEQQQLQQTPEPGQQKQEPIEEQEVRRSGRARKSTTIKINGEIVLAKNNYVVTGSGYKYGAVPDNDKYVEEEKQKSEKRKKQRLLLAAKRAAQKAAATMSAAEGETTTFDPTSTAPQQRTKSAKLDTRMKHNAIIKERMASDTIQRNKFMVNHLNILSPFIAEKVQQNLVNIKNVTKLDHDGDDDDRNVAPLSPARKKKKMSNQNNITSPSKAKTFVGTTDTDVSVSVSFTEQQLHDVDDDDDKKHVYMQPDLLKTEMRDYQLLGLEWMVKMHKKGVPMILGDEMGLGKTLQTISLICYLKEHEKSVSGPSLVICPLSVLYSWCNEIQKHTTDLKYFRFHASDPKEREAQKETITNDPLKYDIIVTTYEMVKNPMIKGLISGLYFNYVVLDEGHIIKDIRTQISVAVRKVHSQNKLILTGTPLQNSLTELYAILNYLYPNIFTKSEYFDKAFDIGKNEINPQMLLAANKVLNLFMIRRLKEEVERLMPKKIETKIECPLSSIQVFWYKGYLMKDIDALASASEKSEEELVTNASRYNVLRNLVMQLRKCCLHPFLFKGAEGKDIHTTTAEELIAASGKLAVLDKMLRSMFRRGNRTVIFSQFTSMLDILEDYCRMRQWKYCRFDGSTPRAQRNYLINRFNDPDSTDFIFLMSTRSGGLGINLQTADTCILYDSDWNPQPDIQAMARVHRIGQKNTVHVYRLVSRGTVEERVLERAEKKLYLDQMVNRGDRGTTSSGVDDKEAGGLTTAELLSTLRFGSNAVFSSSNELPSDKDINTITDRKRSEDTSQGLLQGGVAKTAKDFDAEKELTSTTKLNGIDFKAIRDEQKKDGPKLPKSVAKLKEEWGNMSMADETGGRGKRVKTNRLVMVQGVGSGYGKAFVPVLAKNNYALEGGEPSVFHSETRKTAGFANPRHAKKSKAFVDNQDFCQVCGYAGGIIILCPRCPISVHETCCGVPAKEFLSCSHHRCAKCGKNTQGAGGLLFACQTCPNSYCEDCLPTEGLRFLGNTAPRLEKLGFFGTPNTIYVHCSSGCEDIAKKEFGWKCPLSKKQKCPEVIDVSYAFGEKALPAEEIAKRRAAGVPLTNSRKSLPPEASRKSPRKRTIY